MADTLTSEQIANFARALEDADNYGCTPGALNGYETLIAMARQSQEWRERWANLADAGLKQVERAEKAEADRDKFRAALRDARQMAVAWMVTSDRLSPEGAVKNVRFIDDLLEE